MLEVFEESGPFQLMRDHHGHLFLYENGYLVRTSCSREAQELFKSLVECIESGDVDWLHSVEDVARVADLVIEDD
ncbi:MAG TPA: hypothetical protein VMZ50_00110 [Phycisphaerae bacterium]|nr:hypothetical protein [Phycisphaerae bacterium]